MPPASFARIPVTKTSSILKIFSFLATKACKGGLRMQYTKEEKKHLKELISDRGTEKIESSMAIGRVHLLRILFICDLVNSITHNKDCL